MEDVAFLSKLFKEPPQELGWVECLWGSASCAQDKTPSASLLSQQVLFPLLGLGWQEMMRTR